MWQIASAEPSRRVAQKRRCRPFGGMSRHGIALGVVEGTDRSTVSRRLFMAVAIPVALLVVVGAILWAQIARMKEMALWVDHTDRVIARIYDVQKQIADQESALRGYLISEDRSFLEPYEQSQPARMLGELHDLVADNPAQVERVEDATQRYEAWFRLTTPIVAPGAKLAEFRSKAALDVRQRAMSRLRSLLTEVQRVEQTLRHERVVSSDAANNTGVVLAAMLFVALTLAIAFVTRSQLTSVADSYAAALGGERDSRRAIEEQNWVRSEHMKLSKRLQGDLTLSQLGTQTLDALAPIVEAAVGAFYVVEPDGIRRHAGYALPADAPSVFAEGEGLVGRAAAQSKLLQVRDAPAELLRVHSGVTGGKVAEVLLIPALADGVVTAVIELGFFKPLHPRIVELLERIGEPVGMAVRSTNQKLRLRELLEESRRQSEELQTQQEELRVTNEELQAQSDALRVAHAQLEERKEELETSNSHLVRQRDALERVQTQLADKAKELERASRYKSEFLANMSHELRTPLNSSLILAKLLSDNKQGNLTLEQVKFANTIYAAGNDLLALINDILDLSKIEAGRVELNVTSISAARVLEPIRASFEPIAEQKKLELALEIEDPLELKTDEQRLQQILKNLLSNAFKFTEHGEVGLRVQSRGERVEFEVRDTGIGIPEHQHDVIFEAFRQADGTTNRRFGGTGLGLSISRDLAHLLGGELRVDSAPGQGSRFTLSIPRALEPTPEAPRPSPAQRRADAAAPGGNGNPLERGPRLRTPIAPDPPPQEAAQKPNGHRVLLAIEDDPAFADVLAHLARELDFEFLVARSADEGVRLAFEHLPSAVVLDMKLPDHSGLSVLDRLKRNPNTRHIPVHVCSVADYSLTALSMGAAGYLLKPVQREQLVDALSRLKERFARVRKLLVVEDDPVQRDAIAKLLENQAIEIVPAANVADALAELGKTTFDCVVTDLSLPDASGFDLLEQLASNDNYAFPPVIVYTGRSLTGDEEQKLRRYSSSIIIKGARSPERLLDEVTLFLHQVEAELPPDRQRMLRQARDREAVFAGRKILIAEDDVRNIFALGHVLEPKGAELIIARNGREAVEVLQRRPDIDLVLMDIMMPEMDGLTAMRAIRELGGRHAKLPIIALTAKAMPDDQERCIQAGASDYIPKPLDVEMLLSLIRVWMPKS
jgi:signal transduction histidine kinase/CheY-like chemotaxis protein/CHASE3 domain sensor protein